MITRTATPLADQFLAEASRRSTHWQEMRSATVLLTCSTGFIGKWRPGIATRGRGWVVNVISIWKQIARFPNGGYAGAKAGLAPAR